MKDAFIWLNLRASRVDSDGAPGPDSTGPDRLLLLSEQILEDELTPYAAACVHQRATLA
jgi:hypothetical protein